MTWSSTSFAGTSVSSWYAVVADALVLLLFLFRAFARVLVVACIRRSRGGSLLLVLPPVCLATGLEVLWLSVQVSLLVFLVSSGFGLSCGVSSAGRFFVNFVRLSSFLWSTSSSGWTY